MKKVKWTLATGYGSDTNHTGEFEVDDSATEDKIREACVEDAWNYLDLY